MPIDKSVFAPIYPQEWLIPSHTTIRVPLASNNDPAMRWGSWAQHVFPPEDMTIFEVIG